MPHGALCSAPYIAISHPEETVMTDLSAAGTFTLGDRIVKRIGYGAMQLAGPGVFGPPKDHDAAITVLRAAVEAGVNHIDTSDFYGPHVTNRLIREALAPYRDDLVIVTKVGARRGDDASWNPAFTADELDRAVHDNLRNLGLERLEIVNLRAMFSVHGPAEGSIEAPLTALSFDTSVSATSPRRRSRKAGGSPTSLACRITTISRTAATMR